MNRSRIQYLWRLEGGYQDVMHVLDEETGIVYTGHRLVDRATCLEDLDRLGGLLSLPEEVEEFLGISDASVASG